jgi:hypothetical protein
MNRRFRPVDELPVHISKLKKEFLDKSAFVLDLNEPEKEASKESRTLYEKTGQLNMEVEFLKGIPKSSKSQKVRIQFQSRLPPNNTGSKATSRIVVVHSNRSDFH